MNRNKLVLFAAPALALLLTAGSALAQGQAKAQRSDREWHQGPPGAVEQLSRMQQTLNLTDEQSLQLLEVLQAAQAEREALHAQVLASFQSDFCALRETTEAEILAILTPEQAATFELQKQERTARQGGRRGPAPLDCPDSDG